MPEQFVNPSPSWAVERVLFFDFPCEDGDVVHPASTYKAPDTATDTIYPNVNLTPPAIEQIYSKLGSPKKEQGHPFMLEYPGPEAGDPAQPPAKFVDQVVDMDRGLQINHTARLSGSFVQDIASRPRFSQVKVSALAVAPHAGPTASIVLKTITEYLDPKAPAPDVWFWRNNDHTTNELLFTVHVVIPDLSDFGPGPGAPPYFTAEYVYKLVVQWKFWRCKTAPIPATPPQNLANCERMIMSGFDEAIAFEVITQTVGG